MEEEEEEEGWWCCGASHATGCGGVVTAAGVRSSCSGCCEGIVHSCCFSFR